MWGKCYLRAVKNKIKKGLKLLIQKKVTVHFQAQSFEIYEESIINC